MCALTSYFAGVGCDEGGDCNEVVMEVAMDVVVIKGDKDKTLFITHILHTIIHTLFLFHMYSRWMHRYSS